MGYQLCVLTLERIREVLSHCINVQHMMQFQLKKPQKNANSKREVTQVLN